MPDLHELPIDLDGLSGRVRKVAGEGQRRVKKGQRRAQKMAGIKAKKRSRLRLTWPLVAVLGGIGIFMVVRSRRSSSSDAGQSQPSGAYARS